MPGHAPDHAPGRALAPVPAVASGKRIGENDALFILSDIKTLDFSHQMASRTPPTSPHPFGAVRGFFVRWFRLKRPTEVPVPARRRFRNGMSQPRAGSRVRHEVFRYFKQLLENFNSEFCS